MGRSLQVRYQSPWGNSCEIKWYKCNHLPSPLATLVVLPVPARKATVTRLSLSFDQ